MVTLPAPVAKMAMDWSFFDDAAGSFIFAGALLVQMMVEASLVSDAPAVISSVVWSALTPAMLSDRAVKKSIHGFVMESFMNICSLIGAINPLSPQFLRTRPIPRILRAA